MESPPVTPDLKDISALIRLIEQLRGGNGCPWDRKQTPRTLAVYLIEEVYELVDAIESKSPEDVCEELGDVLFQILFMAHLYQKAGHFDLRDVASRNTRKMIRRHPHVFGQETAVTSEEVRQRWHTIKMTEKNHVENTGLLDSVPSGLPALIRAYRISERAARAGFDWKTISGVMEKVEEEWAEFKSEVDKIPQSGPLQDSKAQEKLSLEFGDVLFTLVNVARFAKLHPETSLADSTRKFEKRFRHMEQAIAQNSQQFNAVSYTELNNLWEKAKKAEEGKYDCNY
ncbi:MAG: nucleoside triphosphate pyrophosphohydrolase [Deltaproteobacteria bacterium]|nr:nucleoside triphosphate pyrophosphohydrolase [Deltaproteobacteria bacterium]